MAVDVRATRVHVRASLQVRSGGIARVTDTGVDKRIAFVQSCWHKDIVDQGKIGFLDRANTLGIAAEGVEFFEVPGSFEIPLLAKLLAESGKYSAIVAVGLVVDGGIYRHEFVAEAVISGIMKLQLETDIPIISVVLIPHNFHETEDHREFFRQHFMVKGEEAADACAKTLENLAAIA